MLLRSRGSAAANLALILLLAIAGALIYYLFLNKPAQGSASPSSITAESLKMTSGPEGEKRHEQLLFAQIVDCEPNDVYRERAILEGQPFKWLLKKAALKTCAKLREETDDKLLFENLSDEPDLHRGAAYTPGRGVVLEISRAELGPEYDFPPGWTVLPAVFVNTAREIYALRFICGPNSTLFDRLKKGVNDDALPVINLSGIFLKNYARLTGDPKEKPWVRPLLICPEPEFPENVEPRHALHELEEAGFAHLLPSKRIDAPGAEERMVVPIPGSATNELARSVSDLKKRLPADQVEHPSAVILVAPNMLKDASVQAVSNELKALGVSRVFIKQDFSK